jgi:hypothetical protein
MAQLGTIKVQTDSGIVDVPVFDVGDSGGSTLEALRVQTDQGEGFIALVDPADASRPYLRIQTDSGIKAVNNKASLAPPLPPSAVHDYDAKTISANDGDSISSISDSIGNKDLSGSGAIYDASSFNGNPSLSFSGGTGLSATSYNLSQPYSIITILSYSKGINGGAASFEGSGVNATLGDKGSDGLAWQGGFSALVMGSNTIQGNIVCTGTFSSSGDASIYTNGVEGQFSSRSIPSFDFSDFSFGADNSGSTYNGSVAELVVYNDNLDNTGNRQSEEQRLANKWGISI